MTISLVLVHSTYCNTTITLTPHIKIKHGALIILHLIITFGSTIMSNSIPNHQSVTFESLGGPATVTNNAQYNSRGSPNNFIVNAGMVPSKPAGEYYVKNGN